MANFEAVWWLSVWIYRAHTGLCGSFRLAATGQKQTPTLEGSAQEIPTRHLCTSYLPAQCEFSRHKLGRNTAR